MKHNYLNNTSLNEAKEIYYSHLKAVGLAARSEVVAVREAGGRVLKDAAYARICSPHYNACAMDGIAVCAADTFAASEKIPLTLAPESYTVVDTGDPLPKGCDAVIMVEDLIETESGEVRIIAPVRPWQNVRQVGEDICMGDMLAPSGTVLSPSLCGALLAGGVTEIEVLAKPVFGIIPTGDEIVAPTADPKEGEIIEFNSTIFASYLESHGAAVKVYPITKDVKSDILAVVERALCECDGVLICAGSSAGRDDYTAEIIASLGTVLVHGIAIKPGKPAILGEAQSKPVIGLPGYPVSAIVIMEEIVREVIDLYNNKTPSAPPTVKAVLGKKVVSSLKYSEYIRVALGSIGGALSAVPLGRGAGVITSFTKADGILLLPQNCEGLEAGTTVDVRLLKPLCEIENTLIVTGSHDPLIDEVADALAKEGAPFRVCSTHVGSMGAIYAIQGGLAHLGGVHLLDSESGTYNTSYIERFFPEGGAVLLDGVGRVQGLMVQKGNPLGIKTFQDIAAHRYVNRQRGAGTRILCDYLLEKNGIAPEDVEGYANEEYTHTAVAALIAAGNADAGLGIYSAAKMYDLDFIPICTETYQFLVDERYRDAPQVQAFLKMLHSPAFAKRLEALGGYALEK
ncbi:MAG: molybdopterin biosynthesis protein [Ruminococcaceae bacterium]|nr:molybdopterin biosynthesis protein [Oscillospiraceae bacterium]